MALLTVEQAARRLGRTDRTIRRWIEQGTLKATHPTHGHKGKFLIEEDQVEQLAGALAQEQLVKHEPQPAMDITKRVDFIQGWLGDVQRWLEEDRQKLAELREEFNSYRLLSGPDLLAAGPVEIGFVENRIDGLESRLKRLEQSLGSAEPGPARKRATIATVTPGTPDDIPQGSIHAREFAEAHRVHERTFRDHIDKGNVAAIKRPKLNRPREFDRWLTPENQQQAINYWLEIGTVFTTRPDLYNLDYGLPLEDQDQATEQETKI